MAEIRIPETIAQRLQQAIDTRMSLDAWRKRELAKGIAQGDAPERLARIDLVMKRARRLQKAGAKQAGPKQGR
ncbi:MAG: hypothetical protein ABR570_03950 [Burkholderiales bacterium]